MEIIRDIPYRDAKAPEEAYTLFWPEGEVKALFIFFHGGGLIEGSKDGMDDNGKEFAAAGVAAAFPWYPFLPEVSVEEILRVSARAVKSVTEDIRGRAPGIPVFVGGHSAGGYISSMLCFDRHYLDEVGLKPEDFAGFIPLSGQPTTHYNILRFRGKDERQVVVDETAPLYHVGKNGPPLRIVWAENDLENRPAQLELLVSTLKTFQYESEVSWTCLPGEDHGSYLSLTEDGNSLMFKSVMPFILKYAE